MRVDPPARLRGTWLVLVAHAVAALWLFAGTVLQGRVLFFRDLAAQYYPDYVFLERSLRQGVWPLWHPGADGGVPILFTDPLVLAAVGTLGADGAFGLLPPLYLLIGMGGASLLARRLGTGPSGAWAAGLIYGASGTLLSTVSLPELLHGACWAPWVVAAFLHLWERPTPRSAALLAGAGALQLATLSAELVLQTAVFGLVLAVGRPDRQRLVALAVAVATAALLAAPALAGAVWLLEGSARAAGFSPEVAFGWSAAPVRLLDAVLPRFLGDVHTFGNVGYWGQRFFPEGVPYLLSLYLGPLVLGLALAAGRKGARLWLLAALGVLLAMGDRGPLAPLLSPLLTVLRSPVKFFWLADLAVALLAGLGVERCRRSGRPLSGGLLIVAGVGLVAVGGLSAWCPERIQAAAGTLLVDLRDPLAAPVIAGQWPAAFTTTGVLAVGAGLAVLRGRALAPLAALLAGLDLLIVNGAINPTAERSFYELRPEVRALLAPAIAEPGYRWFSYGFGYSLPGLPSPELAALNSDVWLYYLDRQSLLPRSPVIDGLDSAFDVDRTGWALPGSTLDVGERDPRLFRAHHPRLRLGNVRWVLGFDRLPGDLVEERGRVPLPGLLRPLRLYELRQPLPRAFWLPGGPSDERREPWRGQAPRGVDPPGAGAWPGGVGERRGSVEYARLGPHRVRLRLRGEAGWVVVLDNHHRDWTALGPDGPEPLERANGTHLALATPGGEREVLLRYRPRWVAPALLGCAAGLALAFGLAAGPTRCLWAASPGRSRSPVWASKPDD